MKHPQYDRSLQSNPQLTEISPGHFVQLCACCTPAPATPDVAPPANHE